MGNYLSWNQYQDQIQSLAKLDYNYDEKVYHASKDKQGWNLDKYQATLSKEPPGEPIAKGPFNAVKEVIILYKFSDPRLIRAVFDPNQDLAGRNMLLLAKFLGFHFTFGVRITSVIDEVRKNDKGDSIRLWGYSYRTLTGHFELGEIWFQVEKNLNTGEINFEVTSYSKADRIPNFFYRIGFKIFGRWLQKYFVKSSIKNLQRVAAASAQSQASTSSIPKF